MSEQSVWIQKKAEVAEEPKIDTSSKNWITKKEKPIEWIKKKEIKNDYQVEPETPWITKKKKLINMATGGLMSMPPYIKRQEEKDEGITPYDVKTPESARKGLPARLLGKTRTRFGGGDSVKPLLPDDIPILEEHDDSGIVPSSDKVAGGNAARDHHINKMIAKLENRKEMVEAKDAVAIDNQIKKLENMKSSNIKTAALGGYMDENDIAEQTPLALNIGGAVGRRDERKDYQAYAEGDVVEDDIIEDEALLSPLGIEEEDALAETDLEMTAEDEALGDADAVLDTSMLSEEEEIVLDEAMEMHPELESIIPKIVATEFTEDELVEGPGDGTSDSIPAMLSDGEFVFTAKAVKSLGVDKLRKMMAQAEEAYDAGQIAQEDSAAQFEADSLLA